MRKRKIMRGLLTILTACTVFSMTALAKEMEEIDEIIVSSESDDVLVEAGRPGYIYPSSEIYDAVYSNNTKIELTFDLGSGGNTQEFYTIYFYKGDHADPENELPAGVTNSFPKEGGTSQITYTLDTTDLNVYTEGKYMVVCTSYYRVSGTNVENNKSSATFELEDYRRVHDREFVSRLYQKVFGRQADAAGLNDWTNRLFEGKTTGATTVEGFFDSNEFTQKNTSDEQYVDLLYEAIFDRPADDEGKQNWMNVLNMGVSRKYVLCQFVNSAEFHNLCNNYGIQVGSIALTQNRDKNLKVTGFVNRLYNIALNRAADESGINDWTGLLLEKKKTPKQVASGFVFSPEMNNRNLNNTEFVTLLYRVMMDREPDEGGLKDWVGRLDNGAKRVDVFNGFADSVEFGRIVSSYGL